MLHLVVLPVLLPYSSSTRSTMLVPVSPMTLNLRRAVVLVNSTAWLMSTVRPSHPMALRVSTVASFPPLSVSLSIVASTSVSMIRLSPLSLSVLSRVRSWLPSVLAGVLLLVLALHPTLLIPSGASHYCSATRYN